MGQICGLGEDTTTTDAASQQAAQPLNETEKDEKEAEKEDNETWDRYDDLKLSDQEEEEEEDADNDDQKSEQVGDDKASAVPPLPVQGSVVDVLLAGPAGDDK